MSNKEILLKGTVVFNPINVTKKHNKQSYWKRVAMVVFEGDMSSYYSWFIFKRYGVILNQPLRNSHITFVNDSIREIVGGDTKWEEVRKEWDGKEIEITLNLDARNNSEYWWLKSNSEIFEVIRGQLGLGKPYFNYHMTIGYANERNIEHATYIQDLIEKFGGEYAI